MDAKKPHDIDVIVGRNLRFLRNQRRISQMELGEAVAVSFQQIQKYEKGSNRISASRLHEFSRILNVDIAALFAGTDPGGTDNLAMSYSAEALAIANDYQRIADTRIQNKIKNLIAALAETNH